MALISCPECGASVSNAAPSCIKCGFPLQSESTSAGVGSSSKLPRTDGVYVGDDVIEHTPFLKKKYGHNYLQFFDDGHVFYAELVDLPGKTKQLPLDELKDRKNGRRSLSTYVVENGRFKISHPNGAVNYALADNGILVLLDSQGKPRTYSTFYEFQRPVFE